MAFNIENTLKRKAPGVALGLGTALLLASCGGGGGSAGGSGSSGGSGSGSGTGTSATYTLSLTSPTTSSIDLAAYGSTTLAAKLTASSTSSSTGTSTPPTITFTSPCASSGKATITVAASTSTTASSATYTDNGCGTTDLVTVAATGVTSVIETIVVSPPAPASIDFVSATPSAETIVIAGSGGSGRSESASLVFKVLDTHGNALPNETVNFSLVPAGVVTLQTTTASTDSTGQATAVVSSGSQATTFRVVATLPTGQSTMSDTISVTTGQTSPNSMSVSVKDFNIDGWDFDNVTTNVNVLLADSNGNPVADNTPVVAETDSGAIGSSTNGGCVTTDGACTMIFRSQNPRYGVGYLPVPSGKRAGLATIVVSTTTANQSAPIYGYAAIFLSAGEMGLVLPTVDPSSGATILPPTSTVPGYTIKLTSCFPLTAGVQVNDINNNPMPSTTTLTSASASQGFNAAGAPNPALSVSTISPSTVPSQSVDTLVVSAMAKYQGTSHSITFQPAASVPVTNPVTSACSTSGAYPVDKNGNEVPNGVINISSKSPGSVASGGQIFVWYPQSP